MFGRKKNEDYDDYNEKYASKYDDDYIAPSKEYRAECDHSHEQSYSNVNNVRECDHSHEQTYEDADYEQRSYDNYASIESRFQPYLTANEHILWVGGHDKQSPAAKDDPTASRKGAVIGLIIGIILTIVGAVTCVLSLIGIVVIIISALCLSGVFDALYAITDIRVITLQGGKVTNYHLRSLSNVRYISQQGNIGYVTFENNSMRGPNGVPYSCRIGKVHDPARVSRILSDAVRAANAPRNR